MKHKTLKGLVLALGGLLLGALLIAQPFQDPVFHSFRDGDPSYGIFFGTVFPSIASTGTEPPDGILFLERTADAGDDPRLWMYSNQAAAWNAFMTLAGGVGTANTLARFDGAGSLEDSSVTDDGADLAATLTNDITLTAVNDVNLVTTDTGVITLTSAGDIDLTPTGDVEVTVNQLLLPDGTAGAPSVGFTSDNDGTGTGIYRVGADTLGVSINGFITTRVNTGGIDNTDGTAIGPSYSFASDINTGLYSIGGDNLGIGVGGALVMSFENTNAAGAGADLTTISSTLEIMDDNADIFRGAFVDLVNANHTAAVTSPLVYGLDVDDIVADDEAEEYAIHLDASWDHALFVEGTTQDVDHGITAAVMLSPTLAANDNANDQRSVLIIDVDVPNGSAGLVNGINIDGVTDDINSLDSAIFIEAGWDSSITLTNLGHAPSANPLTQTGWFFLDDSVDYSGGGGVDCWLVFRDATPTNHQVVQLVLNGACP